MIDHDLLTKEFEEICFDKEECIFNLVDYVSSLDAETTHRTTTSGGVANDSEANDTATLVNQNCKHDLSYMYIQFECKHHAKTDIVDT